MKVSPLRYVVLAALFVCALAFQISVSFHDVKGLWADAHNFHLAMLKNWALLVNLHFVTPFACLLLGFYVAAVRIWDARAWLMLAVLITFSVVCDGSNRIDEVMQWQTPIKHLAMAYRSVVILAWPICMFLFAIYFPERADFDSARPALKWVVLTPAIGIYLLAVFIHISVNEGGAAAALVRPIENVASQIRLAMLYLLLGLFLIILLIKLFTSRDFDDRRRLRILFIGLAISFVPAVIVDSILRQMFRMHNISAWVAIPAFTALALFPITLAYVTVVQRALDVRVILRQGLQYAMARRGLIVIQTIDSAIVVLVVAVLSGRLGFLERVALTTSGIGIIFLIGAGMRRLAVRVDRRFFREAYNAEQILARLSESVGSLIELQPLLRTVATRIAEALHISEIAVFLCEQNSYRLAFALGYSQPPQASFDNDSPTIGELQRTKQALPVYFDDPRSWTWRINSQEHGELSRLRTQLLLPLARREELLGFLSLGRRNAEAPYGPNDVDLLQSVAQQTALAVENSRLTSTIAAETAEREVIQRELAIARDVQQRLLPQTFPKIAGLDCFGTCRPAREVGGDYYDFLELPGGALGVAIGDVSGKGIPASLLMASLQASLRGQTLSGYDSLERLMNNINQLICAASPVNRYATFFYAQLNPNDHLLTYVNAGHNAPMVIHKASGEMQSTRLEVGGPPVGLLPDCQYQSAQVELREGDLIVLFTDGISEAMNMQDEEWGEERLMNALRSSDGHTPNTIVETVFRLADQFTGGAPQHDDMTIVVLAVGQAFSSVDGSSHDLMAK